MGPKASKNRGYRIIDHTADIGFEVEAGSLEALFASAGRALFDLIAAPGAGAEEIRLSVSGDDWPDLMYRWLRELFYLWSGKGRLVAGIRIVSLVPYEIEAVAEAEPFDAARHRIRNEIKAVTYHQLAVDRSGAGWRARVILDM